MLEAVAGVIEDVDAATCAHREVMEEALLKLDSLEHVFTAWTMPGLSTEHMHFFLATYSGGPRPEMRGGVDEDEYTVAVEIGACRTGAHGRREPAARHQDARAVADIAPAPAGPICLIGRRRAVAWCPELAAIGANR